MDKKINLLIPIAGKGQRFIDAGYKLPKQLIKVGSRDMIDVSLDCIDYSNCNLIFVIRPDHVSNFKLDDILRQKYGENIKVVITPGFTRGSVESCLAAKEHIYENIPLVVYTLDVEFSPRFNPYCVPEDYDGCILTFKSNSPNYSYVEINERGFVTETAEKNPISPNACVGVYYFKDGRDFVACGERMIENNDTTNGEFYITPLYNYMISAADQPIVTREVEKMHIFGTPSELDFYLNNVYPIFGNKPIGLCNDHSGFAAKQKAIEYLEEVGYRYIDFGSHTNKDCDYKDYITEAVRAKDRGEIDFILGFCRTGQGVNICANKFDGIRAALMYNVEAAEMSVRHNAANFFSIPDYNKSDIHDILDRIRHSSFDGGRHQVRIMGIEDAVS